MEEISPELARLIAARIRRKSKAASTVPIDREAWLHRDAMLSPMGYEEFYDHTPYACRRCRRQCMFSADDKKHAYEVLKKPLQWAPALCDQCHAVRSGLQRELRDFNQRWRDSRRELRSEAAALGRWLEVLERLPEFGVRRDPANTVHVRRLLAAAQAQRRLAQDTSVNDRAGASDEPSDAPT